MRPVRATCLLAPVLVGLAGMANAVTLTGGVFVAPNDAAFGPAPTALANTGTAPSLDAILAAGGIVFASPGLPATLQFGTVAGQYTLASPFSSARAIGIGGASPAFDLNGNVVQVSGPLVTATTPANAAVTLMDSSAGANGTLILAPPGGSNPYLFNDWHIAGGTLQASAEALGATSVGLLGRNVILEGGNFKSAASTQAFGKVFLIRNGGFDVNGLTVHTGDLQISDATLTMRNTAATNGTLTVPGLVVAGSARITLAAGTGSTTTLLTLAPFSRVGAGQLQISAASDSSLATNAMLKGSAGATSINGILQPWITVVSSTGADFATGGTSLAGITAASYTAANLNASSGSTVVAATGATVLSGNRQAYALKLENGASVTGSGTLSLGLGTIASVSPSVATAGGSFVLTNGDTIHSYAGLIMNGASIATATLAFGVNEPIITTSGTNTISAIMTGSNGLTIGGTGALALTAAAQLSGSVTLNSGTLTLAAVDTLASASGVTLSGPVTDAPVLALAASNQIAGLASTGSGTASVVLNRNTLTLAPVTGNTASFTGTLSGGTVAIAGAGIQALAGRVNGTLAVRTGTLAVTGGSSGRLTVVGGYAQAPGGMLQVTLDPGGAASRIDVTGAAQLAGTLSVNATAASTAYVPGTRSTVLTATAGVSGQFASVVSNTTLTWQASSDATNVYVTPMLTSPAAFAATANQRAAGAALNQALLAGYGASPLAAAQALLAQIGPLSTPQLQSVLDRSAGEIYGGIANTILRAGHMFTEIVSTDGGEFADTTTRVQLASVDPAAAGYHGPDRPWGAWITGYGQFSDTAGNANAYGSSSTLGGGAVGVDYRVAPDTIVGLAIGYGGGNFATSGTGASGTTNFGEAAIYARHAAGAAYITGMAGLGVVDASVTRDASLPSAPAIARGGVHGMTGLFGGEVGSRHALPWTLSVNPFAALRGGTYRQGAMTEQTGGALGLSVAGKTSMSVNTVLGARLSGQTVLASTRLLGELKLGWSHEFADTARPVNASFQGFPGTGFTSQSVRATRDHAAIGVGLGAKLTSTTDAFLRYDGEIGSGDTLHAARAGLRMTW